MPVPSGPAPSGSDRVDDRRVPVHPGTAPSGSDEPQGPDGEDHFVKPLLYAALLERKSDTPEKIKQLLAQVRAEHGSLPEKLVYRVHSDMGTEFTNTAVKEYLLFHGIQQTTTQGYDPSSNGPPKIPSAH